MKDGEIFALKKETLLKIDQKSEALKLEKTIFSFYHGEYFQFIRVFVKVMKTQRRAC